MIGLIKKDFFVLKAQKFYIILGIFLLISLTIGYEQPVMGVFASAAMAATLSLTTIAYDDFNHSTAFLLTLPITRKTYVVEKYVLSLLLCTAACLISSVLLLLIKFSTIASENILLLGIQVLCAIPAAVCVPALLIPVNLKFGSERGRMIMIILFMALGVLFSILFQLIPADGASNLIAFVTNLNPWLWLAGGVAISALIIFTSVTVSNNIMQNKEF